MSKHPSAISRVLRFLFTSVAASGLIAASPAVAGGEVRRFMPISSSVQTSTIRPSVTSSEPTPAVISGSGARFLSLSSYQPTFQSTGHGFKLASLSKREPVIKHLPPTFRVSPNRPFGGGGNIGWVWPVAGNDTRITSPFGVRSDPIHKHAAIHQGTDIAAPAGTAVLAAADGIVQAVGRDGRLGRYVRIMHAGNVESVYGHLATTSVVAGRRIEAGEKIGQIGMSGRTTGPHLHFALKADDAFIDPMTKLDMPVAVASAQLERFSGVHVH